MSELKQNPKCSKCRCYWKPDDSDIKPSGLYYKICKKCREYIEKNKCEHSKVKSACRKCGGSSFCEHKRQKSTCKECGGSGICEHNRQKQYCKECDGISICEHKRVKSTCKECGGSQICKHNKRKAECKECGGSQICKHNKKKTVCIECKGSGICEHNTRKNMCKECNLKLYLVNLQRKHINRCLKLSTIDKTKHSIEYLDCSIEDFIKHFEKKMEYFNTYLASDTLMTWDNIHIDHIKPVSKFDLDEEDEFLDCCHYTNLQPLIDVDNMEKSNKWTDENNEYWEQNIKGNENYCEIYM
jgi:hypothetical protein